MFGTLLKKMRYFLKGISEVARQRRKRKLAEVAAMEKRERRALVEGLANKFAEAHAECEENDKAVTVVEVSLKEIIFIEWNLNTWSRHLKESEVYEAAPDR